MSMICCLREADESLINQLSSNPENIVNLLEQETDEVDLDKAWQKSR
jgi:hypothetical protein